MGTGREKSLDDAAADLADAIEKIAADEPETGVAKIVVALLAAASGSPWLLLVEPLLARVLARLNNKHGKDAVLAIALEVETEEGYRRIAREVGTKLDPVLRELSAQLGAAGLGAVSQLLELATDALAMTTRRWGMSRSMLT